MFCCNLDHADAMATSLAKGGGALPGPELQLIKNWTVGAWEQGYQTTPLYPPRSIMTTQQYSGRNKLEVDLTYLR